MENFPTFNMETHYLNMTNLKYIVLFLFSFLFFTSCNDKPSTSEESTPQEETLVQEESKEPVLSQDERSNWQKPFFIIENLGDLNGKTVADIGAGIYGYFVFKLIRNTEAAKVIAIDIDKEATDFLSNIKSESPDGPLQKLDVRLALPHDPKIGKREADKILIVNTVAFINDRINYFKNLFEILPSDGQLLIVDFKTKRIPDDIGAPPYSSREYLHVIEDELYKAGFDIIETDDTSLEFQYLINAFKK